MRTTISRVAPCPCGSGLRYKHCHGKYEYLQLANALSVPLGVLEKFAERHEHERAYKRLHGVKPPVTTEVNGRRIIFVGKEMYSTDAKFARRFTDFLPEYAEFALGKDWLAATPSHPAAKWRDHYKKQTAVVGAPDSEPILVPTTNAMLCWLRFAHDLFLIRNNAHLQERMLDKLRHPNEFQGARYELAVTAWVMASGFAVEYEDESDLSRPHGELEAYDSRSGFRFLVEAKSKRRDGLLGFKKSGWRSQADWRTRLGIRNLLEDSFRDMGMPYFVFVEANVPRLHEADWTVFAQNCAIEAMQERSKWNDACPVNALIVTNDASYYDDEDLPKDGYGGHFCWIDRSPVCLYPTDTQSILDRLKSGMVRRLKIPQEFPPDF